jgi:hypothetical protein
MITELGRSVNVGRLYSEFRSWLDTGGVKAVDALSTLGEFADAYETLTGRRQGLSVIEQLAASRIDRLNVYAATPVLLWLLVQPADVLPRSDRELAFRAVDSFILRRMASKSQTRAYGFVFAEVLMTARQSALNPGRAVIEALRGKPYGYEWPDDSAVAEAFATARYYGTGGMNQDRLRLILGAIDEYLQGRVRKPEPITVDYSQLQVEHVIPQTWRDTWPVVVEDEALRSVAELERDARINRLGNLTLISGPLNVALSNDPWEAKRAELQHHTKLELNRYLVAEPVWSETEIARRGVQLAEWFSEVWPGPSSATFAGD